MRIGQSRSCTFLYKVDNANPSLGKEVSISCLWIVLNSFYLDVVNARVQSLFSSLVGTLSWICSISSFSRISDSPWSFGSEFCSVSQGSSPSASPSTDSEGFSLAPIWKSYYPNQETTSGSTRYKKPTMGGQGKKNFNVSCKITASIIKVQLRDGMSHFVQ